MSDNVRLVTFNPKGEFLLVTEKADSPYDFKLVGGKFASETETYLEAMERERREEIGRAIGAIQYIGERPTDDAKFKRYIFWQRITDEDADSIVPTDDNDIATAGWYTEATVPECKNKNHILTAAALARAALYDATIDALLAS